MSLLQRSETSPYETVHIGHSLVLFLSMRRVGLVLINLKRVGVSMVSAINCLCRFAKADWKSGFCLCG